MKKIYITFVCILSTLYCSAQVNFQSGFGDTLTDDGSKVVKTTDGGYCIVGATGLNQTDGSDIAVYFINYLGEMNSSIRIGLSKNDFPTGIENTADSGFIITGTTYSSPADLINSDIFVLKINSFGDVIWSNVYGGAEDDEAHSIKRTPDNNYLIAGNTKSYGAVTKSALVLKIDENGNQLWSNVSNISPENYFNQVDITFDNNYILGGGTSTGSDDDNLIVKMDPSGNILWSKKYGTPGADWVSDIKSTSDSGFIIAGISTVNTAGDTDQCIMKLDSMGALNWAYNYGTTQYDRSFSVIENAAHNYVTCGYTNVSPPGGTINQLLLNEIDGNGNLIWSFIYGDSVQTSEGYYLLPGINDGYVALGYSVAFGDPNGDALFIKTIDDGVSGCDEFTFSLLRNSATLSESSGATGQIIQINSQPIALFSENFSNSYGQNCFYDNVKNIVKNNSNNNSAIVYPNPAQKLLNIETEIEDATATIFDQLGRSVIIEKLTSLKTTIDISSLSQGVYFLQLKSKNKLTGNKFIKE